MPWPTHFCGVGDTAVEDHRTQEIDNVSEGESQDENLMRQVLVETANIKQFVEEKYHEPREAIHKIEQRLNDLTLTLHHQNTPIKSVLDRYTKNLVHCTKENIFGEYLITRHTHIKWAELFTA